MPSRSKSIKNKELSSRKLNEYMFPDEEKPKQKAVDVEIASVEKISEKSSSKPKENVIKEEKKSIKKKEKVMVENDFDFVDDFAEEMEKPKDLLDDNIFPSSIKVGAVGIGGCGNHLAEAFFKLGFYRTLLVNSTEKDFPKGIDKKHLVLLDGEIDGLAKNMKLGKSVLLDNSTKIEDALRTKIGDDIDFLLVMCGLGAGTGSSASVLNPTFKKYLKSIGAKGDVIYLATIPSAREKMNKTIMENAKTALNDLKNETIIVLDNEKAISRFRGKVGISSLYPKINEAFAKLFLQFLKTTKNQSDISVCDGEDLTRFLKSKGRILLGTSALKETGEDMGSKIYNSCLETSLCPKPKGNADIAVLLQILNNEMAESPEVSSHIENVQGYCSGRSQTFFGGVYLNEKVKGMINLLGLSGLPIDGCL